MAIASGYSMGGGAAPSAAAPGYQMGWGWGGVPGAKAAEFQQGRPGQAPLMHAYSTGGAKTLQQAQYEAYMAKYFPERPAAPAAPGQGGSGVFLIDEPRHVTGTALAPGQSPYRQAPSSLPPIAEPMALQEPLQPGMFEGSMTFLSARVDASLSEAADAAVRDFEIHGENIVRGSFRRRRPSEVHE